jgi:hypothetical protein
MPSKKAVSVRRIPTVTTANLHELLPANWKPQAA